MVRSQVRACPFCSSKGLLLSGPAGTASGFNIQYNYRQFFAACYRMQELPFPIILALDSYIIRKEGRGDLTRDAKRQ
jgi:hypothetical protein